MHEFIHSVGLFLLEVDHTYHRWLMVYHAGELLCIPLSIKSLFSSLLNLATNWTWFDCTETNATSKRFQDKLDQADIM